MNAQSTPEFQLIQDDDSNWYVIPAGHEQVFQHWLAYMEGKRRKPNHFEPIRVDGPHRVVFTGWREIE